MTRCPPPDHVAAELRRRVADTAPLTGPRAACKARGIVATLALGLVLDRHGGIAGQIAVSAWVWALWAWLLHDETPAWRRALVQATAFATAAELFLSLVEGWYDYRLNNVPPFVPPGHVLLFMLGPTCARRLPGWLVSAAPAAALAWGAYAALAGLGGFDLLLALVFAAVWRRGRSHALYAAMLLLALGLELWGTWLGNWTWAAVVPSFGLGTTNPPLLIGALYGLFDLWVLRRARHLHRRAGFPAGAPAAAESY